MKKKTKTKIKKEKNQKGQRMELPFFGWGEEDDEDTIVFFELTNF